MADKRVRLPTLLQRPSTDSELEDPGSPGTRKSKILQEKTPTYFDSKAFTPSRKNAEISRRYDIADKDIGHGSCGKVFLARDKEVRERMVAIKKVIVTNEDKKHAFLAEAEIMKDLDHPNICKLLETYDQGDHMFFVMEYCEGGELFDQIMATGYMAESITAKFARQTASALLYAHNRGIAHRDLKPENVCLCSSVVAYTDVKLIDWGLAHYFSRSRMSRAIGTMDYAAPEVFEATDDDCYTASCDIWSLGVMIYVMLCGKPPFWGSYPERVTRMRMERFPMRDSTWQQISPAAKSLIRDLLRFDPSQRLQLEHVLQSPWLSQKGLQPSIDPAIAGEVLQNLHQFSNTSRFFSICVASIARQLDHHKLQDIHKVFLEMDTNCDGVLELHEIRDGFHRVFGSESQQAQDVETLFASLDLDGSGSIDYTEFCAAGLGERMIEEEDVLWAAFKAFDVQDRGKVSKEEVKQVLLSGSLCEASIGEMAEEIFEQFDEDGDGSLDFQEWLSLIRESASRPRQLQIADLGSSLVKGDAKKAFSILSKMQCQAQSSSNISTESTASSSTDLRTQRTESEGSSLRQSVLRFLLPFKSFPCMR